MRANIMLVVAYRRAALELIFNVKNKTLSIETQTRSIRTIHNLLYLESAVVIYSTVVMHAFRITAQHISPAHTHIELLVVLVCMRQVADIEWTSHRTQ